jgi:hypothetical protein
MTLVRRGVSVGAAVGGKMCSKEHSLDKKKCEFMFSKFCKLLQTIKGKFKGYF